MWAFGRWPVQHSPSDDPECEGEQLVVQRVGKMKAAACLPLAAVQELEELEAQHRSAQRTADLYSWIAEIRALQEQFEQALREQFPISLSRERE